MRWPNWNSVASNPAPQRGQVIAMCLPSAGYYTQSPLPPGEGQGEGGLEMIAPCILRVRETMVPDTFSYVTENELRTRAHKPAANSVAAAFARADDLRAIGRGEVGRGIAEAVAEPRVQVQAAVVHPGADACVMQRQRRLVTPPRQLSSATWIA